MWSLIIFGVLPGIGVSYLYQAEKFRVEIRISSMAILGFGSLYFLSKLMAGPPIFYWQPPLMIPNQVFYLVPPLGSILGFVLFPMVSPENDSAKGRRYQHSTVTANELDRLQSKLLHLVDVEKIYLRKDLCLEDLSLMLHSDRHTVSRLINERFEKNFFNFINSLRIRYFIRLVADHNHTQGFSKLAETVGFSSKTSFFKAFKRETQQTPTEFFRGQQPTKQ